MNDDEEATPLKNVTSGGGCGCGCLGLLIALVGGFALLGIPLELFTESQASSATIGGISAIVSGLLLLGLGLAMYVGSLFLR